MRYRLILLLLLIGPCAHGQKMGQPLVDSLLAELPRMKEDSNTINLLIELSVAYSSIDVTKRFSYVEQALALAQKSGNKKGEAKAYNNLGLAWLAIDDFPNAMTMLYRALGLYEQVGSKKGVAAATYNLGLAYYRKKDYPKALSLAGKCLSLTDTASNKGLVLLADILIACIHTDQHHEDDAMQYDLKALRLAEQMNDLQNIIILTGNIGIVRMEQGQYSEALACHFKALRLSEQINSKVDMSRNMGNIGETYLRISQQSSYKGQDRLIPTGRAAVLDTAVHYLNRAIAIGREINYKDGVLMFTQLLSDACKAQGKPAAALEAYTAYATLKDSLFNIANSEKIANLETRRALELKDKDILIARLAIVKRRNERVLFAAGVVLLVLFGGISFYRFRRQKLLENRQALLNERLRISRDLHDDMGATLSSISVYSSAVKQRLSDSKIAEAQMMLDTISADARDMVDNMSDTVWMINPKNDTVEKLFDRMQLFASNVLTAKGILFHFDLDAALTAIPLSMEARKNTFLIFKEAINNAAKYAQCSTVEVSLRPDAAGLCMQVKDDGAGFDTAQAVEGNGLRNMRERAAELQGRLEIATVRGAGTAVSLRYTLSPQLVR